MSIISTSSPFLRKFTHTTTSVTALTGGTAQTLVAAVTTGQKRVSTIVQNQSATATVTLILSPTDTVGLVLQPATFFAIENYSGPIRVFASATATPVHLAVCLI